MLGVSISKVIHAIALDSNEILHVSSQINGPYGVRGTCFSLPTVVGRRGVVKVHEIELWPKEVSALQASARALDETWSKLA